MRSSRFELVFGSIRMSFKKGYHGPLPVPSMGGFAGRAAQMHDAAMKIRMPLHLKSG
jgi:hypothetical protein